MHADGVELVYLLRDNITVLACWQFLVYLLQVLDAIMLFRDRLSELLMISNQVPHVAHVFCASSIHRPRIFTVKNAWTDARSESSRSTVFLILLSWLDLLAANSSDFGNIGQFAHVSSLYVSGLSCLDHGFVVVVFELLETIGGGCCRTTGVQVIHHLTVYFCYHTLIIENLGCRDVYYQRLSRIDGA